MNKIGGLKMIIFFFLGIVLLLVGGFLFAVTMSAVDFGSDVITPELSNLGLLDDGTNLSDIASTAITPVNNIIQASSWFVGLALMISLIFSFIFVYTSEGLHPVWMGVYFAFMIFIILISILISNSYQDIITPNDEIGSRLQSQTLSSYIILYSPTILLIIMIVSGIIMFTRRGRVEETG